MKYDIVRSNRKTLSIEIRGDASVLVRAPKGMRESDIERYVLSRSEWIEKHVAIMKERIGGDSPPERLTEAELGSLAAKAKEVIPDRVRHYASILGVTYGKVTIRAQKTKWGSCSSSGNLSFNCLLMLMPEGILDYVVVHELAHRREMNHSPAFWSVIEEVMPDYRERQKWLKENGARYMYMAWG